MYFQYVKCDISQSLFLIASIKSFERIYATDKLKKKTPIASTQEQYTEPKTNKSNPKKKMKRK